MQHVTLGRTGLPVSRLCLGTMTFGFQCDEAQSFAILDAAADAGIDFLDTADVYPLGGGAQNTGRTEEIVGKWLKGRRQNYVLATKCVGRMGPNPWDQGMSRKHILDAIDGSLRRLGVDYVDLYQLHNYDPQTPLDEALEALTEVVRSGKARYVGLSNWPAHKVARLIGRGELKNLVSVTSLQPRYNVLFRTYEKDLLPLCLEEGIGVIPYNPLAGGLLTGKHDRQAPPPEGTRFMLGAAASNYQQRYWHDAQFDTVEAFCALAAEAGLTPATLAVAWVLAHPAISSPIIGASRPEQLKDNLAALEVKLDADLKARIDEISDRWRMVEL